jgi:hypothetical protein
MNIYRIFSILLWVLLLIWIFYFLRCRGRYIIPNTNRARYPPPKCVCAPAPAPAPAPTTPASDAPLDKSNTTTDTSQCGAVWELKPSIRNPDGTASMNIQTTPCFKLGSCVKVEIPDSSACTTNGDIGMTFLNDLPGLPDYNSSPSYRWDLDFSKDTINFGVGTGGWPGSGTDGTITQTVPSLKSKWSTGTNMLKYCFVNDTTTDLYINGSLIGSFTHAPVDYTKTVTYLGIDVPCISSSLYAQVV